MQKYILKDNQIYAVSKEVDVVEYAKKFGGVVIDETHDLIAKPNKLAEIDANLDELAKDLLHNETYKYDDDYQATKDDILIKMQNLREDREALIKC